MPLKTIRTLATAAAAFLLLIGCGGEESTPDPQESVSRTAPMNRPKTSAGRNKIVEQMDPDGKGMHLTATRPDGKKFNAAIGDEVEIPSEFPADVPIYPGSTPMAFMSAPDEGIIVTFKSTEQQQDIFDFYRGKLRDDGWKVVNNPELGSQLAFDATKEDRRVSVVVAGTKGDSRISVIVTPDI